MSSPTLSGHASSPSERGVTAVLGPTNTGKTHLAIERMLAHSSGVIGLPLRLLAREVYNRVAERVGPDQVALITGEEKITPKAPRYRVCTVEAMPTETDASFLAIDEVQLAADLERGHIFTDRILHLRGRDETLLLGAATMRQVITKLVPGVNVVTRPRLSVLSYSGTKKITRLPRRSAVVAFSADEVYAIGELIRRQRGGVAVVLGALSPRTRNAQVELYQSGDVDYLVATDAIGMGLNLDLDHVAFASDRKFDGFQHRRLTPAEFAQVAGRAGRHTRDGTFGVTGRVDPMEDELVAALEAHRFDQVKMVQWRNTALDFSSLAALRQSLEQSPTGEGMVKALPAEDIRVLETAMRDPEIAGLADTRERIELLWDVCQLPDYRRIAPANHADLVLTVFGQLVRDRVIDETWFADQIAHADRTDGDIDTLSNRIAHIRTWNYAANRSKWLANQTDWQERTRAIEDRLSDALHEKLTQRFVDRRTSVLMRRLRENTMAEAEITDGGDVIVEGQHVGQLQGFRFVPDPGAGGSDAKAIRVAAQKALAGEIGRRVEGITTAGNDQFALAADGALRWRGIAVARLVKGDDLLRPRIALLAEEGLTGPSQEAVAKRLDGWLEQHCQALLKPLFDLRGAETLPSEARGLAFRLAEELGVIERKAIAEEVRSLDQDMRAGLRQLGVRFGAYHIYVPQLLKPGPSGLLAMLWGLSRDGVDIPGIAELPAMSAAGRTTIPHDPSIPKALYRVVGYRVSGERAVRIDILERLADLIRPLTGWRATAEQPEPPEGAVPPGGFLVTQQMTSLLGASGEAISTVLRSLGYQADRRPAPPKTNGAGPVDGGEAAAMPEATRNTEPDGTHTASAAESSEPAGPAAADDAVLAEIEATPAEAAAADAADTTSAVTDVASEPEEPAFIEIWRPGRGPRQRSRPPRQAKARPPKRGEGEARGKRRGEGDRQDGRRDQRNRPPAGKRIEPKRIDPDSPFAALAALKAELEGRKSE
jgi:ATP-dependent RNA helicase SUPV3L1/SUV3